MGHYGFINRLVISGHVPQTGFYSQEYSAVPGAQIAIGTLSIAMGTSVNDAIKLVLPIISALLLLMLYVASRRVFSREKQRFILIAASFLLPVLYYIRGSTFGLLFFASFLYILLSRLSALDGRRQYTVLLAVITFSLVITHGFSAFLLFMLLVGTMLVLTLLKAAKKIERDLVRTDFLFPTLILGVSCFTLWIYQADFYLNDFLVNALKLIFTRKMTSTIPSEFFRLSLADESSIFAVRFSNYAVVAVLSIVGLLVLYRMSRKTSGRRLKDLYTCVLSFLFVVIILLVPYINSFQSHTIEERYVVYLLVLIPFLAGFGLWRIHMPSPFGKFHALTAFAYSLVVFSLISVSLLQIFPCQPLVPKTDGVYVVDYRAANTIYQRSMINFAEHYSKTGLKIASDSITSWQIFGLTNSSFYTDNLGQIYPTIYEDPLTQNQTEANLILLHYGGISGRLNEPVEFRKPEMINMIRSPKSTVYDNGESFVLFSRSINRTSP
jgi:hypothetical protein